jgi:hypothetical protein
VEKEITVWVGIVLERRESSNRWLDHVWSAITVVPDAPATDGWQVLRSDGDCVQYHYAPVPLTLHRKLGEAYDANVETEAPALWILLDDSDTEPVPYSVRAVTADPYEAQGMLDAGEGLVERVPMPEALVAWMVEFLKQMPDPEKFRKRKRKSFKSEEQQFGKEPIFAPGGQPSEGETE